MARGKKLTVAQSNLLRSEGLNPKEWFFMGEEVTGSGDRLSRNESKEKQLIFAHRTTGERRWITV